MNDDNELMEMVQHGDKKSYETIVLRHRMAAIRFANSFVFDVFLAEDIVQECFVKIYINRMAYKFSFSFKTFLFTVIRNECIDYLRKNKTHMAVALDSISEIATGGSPEDILSKKESSIAVFRILSGLQYDYKTALYLFAIDGMSYKDIAQIMQKSVPQIKITIFRARKKLKKLLKSGDVIEE